MSLSRLPEDEWQKWLGRIKEAAMPELIATLEIVELEIVDSRNLVPEVKLAYLDQIRDLKRRVRALT